MFIRQALYILPGFYWEKAPREKIENRQLKKINGFLKNARSTVRYYNSNSIYSSTITSLDDIANFSIINKAIVREAGDSFYSEKYCNPGSFVSFRTSGSTGEPLDIRHDKKYVDYNSSMNVRRVLATKRYSPFFKSFQVSPMPRKQALYEKFGLFCRTRIPSDLPISEVKKIIMDNKPDCLICFPVYLGDVVASMSEEELVAIRKFLKLIFTESEMLTDHQRAYIEDKLKTEIFDDYASFEMLGIAYECSHHKNHIAEDKIYVEVLDDEGNPVPDGEEGNIVITSYLEKAMPLMRYSMGDKGILNSEPCPCGRTFKTLKLTQGRADHCIYLDNGVKIYTATLSYLAIIVDGIREIYVYQDKEGKITVYYIPLDKDVDTDRTEKFIIDYFMEKIGICPQVKSTDHIPKSKGGKAQYIYSELSEISPEYR